MSPRTSLSLLAALLAFGAVSCSKGPSGAWRQQARSQNLGDDVSVEFTPQAKRFATATYMQLPGEGNLTVVVEPVNPQARMHVRLYAPSGNLPVAEGSSPLEVNSLPGGKYYLYIQNQTPSIATRVKFRSIFKPNDPDGLSEDDKDPAGAREIVAGKPSSGVVDFMNMNRTDHLKVQLPVGGSAKVSIKLDNLRGKVLAAAIPPQGEEVVFDAKKPASLANMPPGDLVIRVQAEEGGYAKYTVTPMIEDADPDGQSGENGTAEGAEELQLKPKTGGNTQVAEMKSAEGVNFDKQNRTDWYKVVMPDKGKFSVQLKLKNPRAKVHAYFGKSESEVEEARKIPSGFNVDVEKATYYVKVQAADKGEASPYTLSVEYYPANYIDAKVLEIDRKNGCSVLVDKGSNHTVRQGVTANINVGGQTVASGVVDQVFATASKVKVFGGDCKFAGATVQIAGGF